jgi:hypothetical protein
MSRRETFLESARAVNDQALNAIPAKERSSTAGGDLAAILNAMAETNRRLEAVERSVQAAPQARREPTTPRAARERAAGIAVWTLAASLITLLGITLLKPDWALRPRQRAELLLGERLYQRLQHMEESERLEVLKSLWAEPPPTSD